MMWSIYPVDESCELAARQTVTCGGAVFTFLHLPEAEGVISFLDALGDLKPAGWHSFYPHPDTGIATRCCLAEGTMTEMSQPPRYQPHLPAEITGAINKPDRPRD